MNFLKSNILSVLALIAMVGLSLYFYGRLPDSIATKFDFDGNPIKHSSKEFVVVLMPILFAGLITLINILLKISPRKFPIPDSKRVMDIIVFGLGLLLLFIHLGMLIDPGMLATFTKYFSLGTALFLIVVGNAFGKTERNFFMGIRVPWTMSTEANWKATHRFAGRLMVIFGVILFPTTYFYSSIALAVTCLFIPTLFPIYYSYRFYMKNEKGNEQVET